MLNIFAKSIMTAARNPDEQPKGTKGYRASTDVRADVQSGAHPATEPRD